MQRRKYLTAMALFVLLFVQAAAAATQVRYVGQATIEKSPAAVAKALLDYGNWCDKGCKYHSPGVVVDQKIEPKKTPSRFFTWTWIRDVKDTKYFSEVQVERHGETARITSRALTKNEKAHIEEFEKATGKVHNALFDTSLNVITVSPSTTVPGFSDVRFETSLTVSGFLALFPKKLEAGLRDSTEAVFQALRRS